MEGRLQLLDGAGPDDGRCHDGILQKPRQGHGGGRFTQLLAQGFVRFQLGPILVDLLQCVLAGAPSGVQLLQGSAQKAAAERAPGNQSQAVVPTGRDDLQFHRPIVQVVDALFAGQAHQTTLRSFLAGGCNIPSREVAGSHIDNLTLVSQLLEGLPNFVPRAFPIHVMHLIKVDMVGLEPL